MLKLGHSWPNACHIVGIRAISEINDTFCDKLYFFSPENQPIEGIGTTIPGRYYLLNLLNPKGTAVLKEGQYVDCWTIGIHNGYTALVQCRPVTVYRDSNRDTIINEVPGTEDTGLFGINIHHAGKTFIAKFIQNFSAGCQVWQDIKQFNSMMAVCTVTPQRYFTYSLLLEW